MKTISALLFALAVAVPAAAQTPAPAADVVGTWDVTVNTQQGAIPSQIKLRKDGAKLVGTIASQMGESALEAEVKEKALAIWFNMQGQNGPMAIEMNGTVDGDKAKGSISMGGNVIGDWIATRAKDAAAKTETPAATTTATTTTAPAASLTGEWLVSVELPNMTATPGLTLKQDGEKVTGDYVSAQYGKFPIAGTVKGKDVVLNFSMAIEGNAMNVTYAATIQPDGTLKGTVNYAGMMDGTFTAKKK